MLDPEQFLRYTILAQRSNYRIIPFNKANPLQNIVLNALKIIDQAQGEDVTAPAWQAIGRKFERLAEIRDDQGRTDGLVAEAERLLARLRTEVHGLGWTLADTDALLAGPVRAIALTRIQARARA